MKMGAAEVVLESDVGGRNSIRGGVEPCFHVYA